MLNRVLLILILGVIITSCRTRKSVVVGFEPKTPKELIECLDSSRISPEWFSVKIATDLTAKGEKNGFTTSMRMRKDSLMWFNIRKGPIVAAISVITPDSIKAMLKVGDKQYFETDFTYLKKAFGVDLSYYMIQDLFLGNPVGFNPEERYKQLEDSSYYVLSTHSDRQIEKALDKLPRSEEKQYIQRFYINPGNCRVHSTIINSLSDTSNISITYHDYKEEDGLLLPNKVTLVGDTPSDTVLLELNFSRYKLDKDLKFPFKVSDQYEKVDIDP